MLLLIILGAAALLLVVALIVQRKRRRLRIYSPYISALHALIEGRKDEALRLLTKAVKRREGDIDAYLRLGNLLREKGLGQKALQIHMALTVRRDLGPQEDKEIQLAIAEDYAALGNIEKSLQTLTALRRKGRDSDIALALHRLYHRNGDYDNAFSMLKDLSRADGGVTRSDRAAYLAAVADGLRADDRMEEARKYAERARKEDRDSPTALFMIGLLAADAGRMDVAADTWNRLLRKEIGYIQNVIPLLEKALYESGNFQKLEKLLRELLEIHPDNPYILNELASFYEKKGELERAVGVLEGSGAVHTGDAKATVKLSSLYMRSNRVELARRVLEEVKFRGPEPPTYYCEACGSRRDFPINYCTDCSGFNTFIIGYEKIAD